MAIAQRASRNYSPSNISEKKRSTKKYFSSINCIYTWIIHENILSIHHYLSLSLSLSHALPKCDTDNKMERFDGTYKGFVMFYAKSVCCSNKLCGKVMFAHLWMIICNVGSMLKEIANKLKDFVYMEEEIVEVPWWITFKRIFGRSIVEIHFIKYARDEFLWRLLTCPAFFHVFLLESKCSPVEHWKDIFFIKFREKNDLSRWHWRNRTQISYSILIRLGAFTHSRVMITYRLLSSPGNSLY